MKIDPAPYSPDMTDREVYDVDNAVRTEAWVADVSLKNPVCGEDKRLMFGYFPSENDAKNFVLDLKNGPAKFYKPMGSGQRHPMMIAPENIDGATVYNPRNKDIMYCGYDNSPYDS